MEHTTLIASLVLSRKLVWQAHKTSAKKLIISIKQNRKLNIFTSQHMKGKEICPEISNQCHQCTPSPSTGPQFSLLMRHTPYGLWSKNRNTLTHAQTYVL